MNELDKKWEGYTVIVETPGHGAKRIWTNAQIQRWPEFPHWVDVVTEGNKLLAMIPEGAFITLERPTPPIAGKPNH